MTYSEVLEYLYSKLPMYQRSGAVAYKKDLSNTVALLNALDNPHKNFKSIHIAGTNGKGTSAHGIASILQLAGYKTGLYTSPHLKDYTERIRIDGKAIDKAFVVNFVASIKETIESIEPSFFEVTVAMAFSYFSEEKVDIAVIETGLGGRLDSTNVITPEVSLITNIGLDHTDLLGDTLEKIATEKAGIIKPGVPVVIGEKQEGIQPIFERKASESNTAFIQAENMDWQPSNPYAPWYVKKNYNGIYACIKMLQQRGWKISDQCIDEGVERMNELTGLKGRFQVLDEQPLIVADVSHNAEGLAMLFEQVAAINKGKLYVVFGTVKEKPLSPLFKAMPKDATVFWTQSSVPRSLKVEELAIQGIMHGIQGNCCKDVNEAINEAKMISNPSDTIVVTGSTFVVAEIDDL
ncbi:MAG: folylpolyglutamate synthase/dihydrofolate synthase family protein [Ekhidna sp.]